MQYYALLNSVYSESDWRARGREPQIREIQTDFHRFSAVFDGFCQNGGLSYFRFRFSLQIRIPGNRLYSKRRTYRYRILEITCQMLTDFQDSFTSRKRTKIATKRVENFPSSSSSSSSFIAPSQSIQNNRTHEI